MTRFALPSALRRIAASATLVGVVVAICLAQLPAGADEGDTVVLARGQSALLHYPGLSRVVIGDTDVADVAVVSTKELILYAKGMGGTDLYIWDDRGVHHMTIDVTDERAADGTAEALGEVLGPDYRVSILGDSTLAIQGIAKDEAELERVETLAAETIDGVEIISLVSLKPPPPLVGPPVDEIAGLLGPGFEVSPLGADAVVVEGSPETLAEATRARVLMDAYVGEVRIVDLVQDPPEVVATAAEERDMLAEALGEDLSVRVIGGSALVVEGVVKTEDDTAHVADVIEALSLGCPVLNGTKVANPAMRQVLVRVKVMEVARDALKQAGVNWGNLGAQTGGVGTGFTFIDPPFLFGQFDGRGMDAADFAAQVSALEQKNRATVLAEPNLLVNDGEEANIHIGGEVPIPVPQAGTSGGAVVTVEYKEFGVRVAIEPQIVELADGTERISMSVKPEVSSIDPSSSVTLLGISIPGFRTRKAETVVDVTPGSTLTIGGLIQHDVARLKRKIPILGDIPIIGRLFTSKEFQEGKTDLVIMVTPEIVEPE